MMRFASSTLPVSLPGKLLHLLACFSLMLTLNGCGGADPVGVGTGETNEESNDGGSSSTNANSNNSNSTNSNSSGGTSQAVGSQNEAEAVIAKMAEAYRTAQSYEDNAVFREIVSEGAAEPQAYETKLYFAYEAPNKIRAEIGGSMIVCDGEKIYGTYYDVPGYVAARDAPEKLSAEDVFFDPRLAQDQLPVVQMGLLLNDNMAEVLIGESAERPQLLESQDLDGAACHRVRFLRRLVTAEEQVMESEEIYWIDQQDYVLRRIEVPSAPGQERSIEFVGARFGADIPAVAFEVDLADSKVVKRLVPATHAASLGNKPEAFEFTTLDGATVTPDSLTGKVAVLDFWVADEGGVCVANLPRISALREKYADNEDVTFVSVNINPEATDETVKSAVADLNLGQAVARDTGEPQALAAFGFASIPYVLILSPEGEVQYCEMGFGTVAGDDPGTRLAEKIDAIVDGGSFAEEILAAYEAELMNEAGGSAVSGGPANVASASIAEATEPATVSFERIWTAPVEQPGNILVVRESGNSQILVHEGYQGLAEVSAAGEVASRPELALDDGALVTFTRTTTDSSGKRYFALAAIGQQQARVYDQDWNLLLSYPEAGTDHPGISDVQFIDLESSGVPQLAVSYFGVVGVQAAKFDGERAWWNRSLRDVTSLAHSTDLGGTPVLLCCNSLPGGALVSLLADGTRGNDVSIAGKFLLKISGADLNGDGFNEFCGIAFPEVNSSVLVGFAADGTELWTYPLPSGEQLPTLNQIGWGQIVGDDPHWIVAGVDGTLHFVAAGGRVLDSFATGKAISGFAATKIDDAPVLLLSTPEGVEAWRATAK